MSEALIAEAMFRSQSRWALAWQLEAEADALPWWKRKEKRLLRKRVRDLRASGDSLYLDIVAAVSNTGKSRDAD